MGTSGYDVVMKTTKFLCPKTTVKLNNIVQKTSHRSAVLGPADLCLASTMLGQNRPRATPSSSLQPHWDLLPASAFGVSPLAVLQHREQPTPVVELNSLLLISHEFPDSSG